MKTTRMTAIMVFASLFVSSPRVWAGPGDLVHFHDYNLKEAVKDALGIGLSPTEAEMASPTFTHLDASNRGITDLTGLEYAVSLVLHYS
jgi:hypothetical protein